MAHGVVAGGARLAAQSASAGRGNWLRVARWLRTDASVKRLRGGWRRSRGTKGADYRRVEFENVETLGDVDAVVASSSPPCRRSKPGDRPRRSHLAPRGTVVVEWNWARFDKATAEWCFQRLGSDDEGWLRHRRDEWVASGQPWSAYVRDCARKEHLHAATTLRGCSMGASNASIWRTPTSSPIWPR